MHFLLLGFALLAVILVLAQVFMNAQPAAVAKQIRRALATVLLVVAAVLAMRGMLNAAAPLLLGAAWLWSSGASRLFGPQAPKSSGQVSRVVTDYLEMELDHDTGQMSGNVLKGLFQGQRIETLSPADLALLWQDCRVDDPQSAQLIEAYLDARHPTWRDDIRRGEEAMSSGPDGRMRVEEAYEILGLKPGADADQIRKAHRELIARFHPDRGGSTYLAAKINEAKDVLLSHVP